MFCFNDYDCIGFDLDNTLCEYRELELVTLIYDILASFLVHKKNYDSNYLLKPIQPDINFLRKGLTLDLLQGNILNVAFDGFILRASHGTRILSDSEIESIYGKDRKWTLAMYHCKDLLATWNGELSEKIRSSLDYFDMCVPLLFGRAVDSVDKHRLVSDYSIYPDILSGLAYMFDKNHFGTNKGEYYAALEADPVKYIKKCSPNLLSWLRTLRNNGKILYLVTSSNVGYANFVAQNGLGNDWKKYFDVIIFYARKPGFFFQRRPFYTCSEFDSISQVFDLKLHTEYSEGNWIDLRKHFCDKLGKINPKCLFIGDNLIQDIYAPSLYKCCDTVAVVKELSAECTNDDKLLISDKWGSFFYDKLHDKFTIWGRVISECTKICVPRIEWFCDKSVMTKFSQFDHDSKNYLSGYQAFLPGCFLKS